MRIPVLSTLGEVAVHGACASVVGLLLLAAGQPIFTDDLWWHLAMGGEYAAHGPWLDADPFLFTALGPPEPAAWLADLSLYAVHGVGGFQLLRVLHVAIVVVILALAWTMLRRASASRFLASFGTLVLAVLAAYRLFQLRPHLFTVLAALVVVRLLVLDGRAPGPGRIAGATAVFVLWANVHGAFLVGLALLLAGAGGAVAAALVRTRSDPAATVRARRLTTAFGLALTACLVNPTGPRALLPFVAAGSVSPDLQVVADEWTPVDPFAWPVANLPPTPLVWVCVWALLIVTLLMVGLYSWAWRQTGSDQRRALAVDPVLAAIGAASLVGMLSAVRLLWLGVFVSMAIGAGLRTLSARPRAARLAAWGRVAGAAVSLALVPGFVGWGDWRMISAGISRESYANPYSTAKYHAHAVWFMSDVGLEGRVYNDYWIGNFLGYWLAPRAKMFVNGSLNVPKDVMEASRAIRAGGTDMSGRTARELLDLYAVDVFFGTGVPVVPPPGRPVSDTTRLPERMPGWLCVFRNLQSAVYLRDGPAHRDRLERVRDYYAERGVPFDPEVGFDPSAVARAAPEWSVEHGVVPADFVRLRAMAERGPVGRRQAARDRLASIHALLGDYATAVSLDERLLDASPGALPSARRLVWSLLHAGRTDEAIAAAVRLEALSDPEDRLSRRLVSVARRSAGASGDERTALLMSLPVFTRPQGRWVLSGFVAAEPRSGRR